MAAPDLGQGAAEPRFTDIFVRRPVLAAALCLSLALIGVRVAIDMPVQQYPTIESASLVVTTPYIGASADVVQGFITDPIERAAATIPGVDFIDSEPARAGASLPSISNSTKTAPMPWPNCPPGSARFVLNCPAGRKTRRWKWSAQTGPLRAGTWA